MLDRWTPDEDAILVKHRERGGEWDGFRSLLPGRTIMAINTRRWTLS